MSDTTVELGLSIVRRIAQLHQAEMEMSTSPRLGGLRVAVINFPVTA
jgi:signal transduction histidine kinase